MAERYVRPPLSGPEQASTRLAVWRFRLVLLLLFAALVVGIFLLVRALVGGPDEGSPGIAAPPPALAAAVPSR